MIPKTEPAENIPKSTSPPSMESIVRDLRRLEKSFISGRERSKNELQTMQTRATRLEFENSKSQTVLEEMKSKIRLLEDQNSKLKSDLEASELDKNLYYNQYQENGRMVRELEAANTSFTNNITKLKKEVQELKLKNKFLKAEMKLLQTSGLESEKPKPEKSDESNAPEWTRSKLSAGDETSDETSNEELNKKMKDSKSSRQSKRKSRSETENENLPKSKKSCPAPVNKEKLGKPKGNVIEKILEAKFWPLPPPTFCAFEWKYLIKWKETKDGLALDDTWECEEDIVKELNEFRKEEERKKIRK